MSLQRFARCATVVFVVGIPLPLHAQFDVEVTISSTGFNASQLAVLDAAVLQAEALWEGVITGYRPGISVPKVAISLQSGSSFADTVVTGSTTQGGFRLSSTARVRVNPGIIDIFASWDGSGPTPPNTEFQGVNFIEELLAHEMGHALGIGSQWEANGVYSPGTFKYTGQHGLNAYREEFDPIAFYVPVENAGGVGVRDVHWDQIMRSSVEEGNPSDPWSLDPRLGIADSQGRDLANEVMTAALDPDFGEPFLSHMTIASLRDIGFTVVPEPATIWLFSLALGSACQMQRRVRGGR